MKNTQKLYKMLSSLYWRTLGKRKIDKIVKDAINEPLPDMKNIKIGELRDGGGYYNGKRVL